MSDFLDSASAESDAVPAIRAAVAYCAKTGASRLVLPGGELRLRPDRAEEKYQFISNNDESLKRIAFDLEGMRDFTCLLYTSDRQIDRLSHVSLAAVVCGTLGFLFFIHGRSGWIMR